MLDEDELADAIKAGLVTDDEQHWIEQQKQLILADYSAIIDRIRDIETDLLDRSGEHGAPLINCE